MSRRAAALNLASRKFRKTLPARREAHYTTAPHAGLSLGYQRRATGSIQWIARLRVGDAYRYQSLGIPDDDVTGSGVLSFEQATTAAVDWANNEVTPAADPPPPGAELTVKEALDAYLVGHLKGRGRRTAELAFGKHGLNGLSGKLVLELEVNDLKEWIAYMLRQRRWKTSTECLSPQSVQRIATWLKAALNRAADTYPKAGFNRDIWKVGLSMRDADVKSSAMDAFRETPVISALVREAYRQDSAFGLLCHVAAETGARYGQMTGSELDTPGLTPADLDNSDPANPVVRVPLSRKGKKVKVKTHATVPVSANLMRCLLKAAEGLPPSAKLLRRSSGAPWRQGEQYDAMLRVVKAVCPDDELSFSTFRHSHAVHCILSGRNTTLLAAQMDTSLKQFERHYAHYIDKMVGSAARLGLMDLSADA